MANNDEEVSARLAEAWREREALQAQIAELKHTLREIGSRLQRVPQGLHTQAVLDIARDALQAAGLSGMPTPPVGGG